jgi:phosphoheptose isomerase
MIADIYAGRMSSSPDSNVLVYLAKAAELVGRAPHRRGLSCSTAVGVDCLHFAALGASRPPDSIHTRHSRAVSQRKTVLPFHPPLLLT